MEVLSKIRGTPPPSVPTILKLLLFHKDFPYIGIISASVEKFVQLKVLSNVAGGQETWVYEEPKQKYGCKLNCGALGILSILVSLFFGKQWETNKQKVFITTRKYAQLLALAAFVRGLFCLSNFVTN